MPDKPATTWIKDTAQIRALESPMRQEIVDAITAIGPCSMADLAAYLGRAVDSLYFHVRKLVKVKLVQELEKRKAGRHKWAIYSMPGRVARIVYSKAVSRSVRKVVAGAVRLSLREFNIATTQKDVRTSGPNRNLWGGRTKGWLSDGDVLELNKLLEQIHLVMYRSEPGPGRSVHSLAWVLTPAQVRPRARLSSRKKGK